MRKVKRVICHLFNISFYKDWQGAMSTRFGIYQAHNGCPVNFRGVYLFISLQLFRLKLELRVFFLPNLLEKQVRERISDDDRTCGTQWWVNSFWEGRT